MTGAAQVRIARARGEADEAKAFGIVDHVYDRRPGLPGDETPKEISEGPTP